MANKTIADRLNAAINTGREAKFYGTDSTSTGTEYEFTPDGLKTWLADEGDLEAVTQVELTSGGTAITIPAGSTLDEALQIVIDAIDPEV